MCRTFSLPELKQSDIFGAVKALERPVDTIADVDIGDLCWSDDDLLNLLEDMPDEIGLEADSAMSEDDSSLSYSSLSDDSVSVTSPPPTVFDMGKNFGAYEGVNLILKLEGCRLTPFQNFDIFRSLMNSGFVHNNLSLHEVIHLVDAFNLQHQQSTLSTFPAQQHQQQHHLYQVTYLFEVNLRFHAIHHTISSLNWELIGVDCR
eukprot:gene8870-6382_t